MNISKRQKKILEILHNVTEVITAEQLCSSINVSPRTIRNEIKEINENLENENIEICSKKGKGYNLNIGNKELLNRLIKDKTNKSESVPRSQEDRADYINFILLENFINNVEYITQIDLADKLYESLSSLKNDIKIAKDKLLEINLSIGKLSNKGIVLEGSEENIRYYINRNINQSIEFKKTFYRIYNNRIQNITRENISDIIKNNIAKFQLRLTDVAFNNLLNYMQICILRAFDNKGVEYCNEEITTIRKEYSLLISNNICSDVNELFDVKLLESDIIFITKQIIGSNIVAKNRQEILARLSAEDLNTYKLVEDIIKSIDIKFGVNLNLDDTLKDFLMYHLKTAIKRATYNIKIENDMLDIIKKNHPFTFSMALLAYEIITKTMGVSLCEGDVGFLSLHFEASMRRLEINNEKKNKKVMVICSTGAGTSLLIKVKLEKYFGDSLVIVDTIPWYEFDERLLDVLDFVITTVPLNNIDMNKVVHIKNLLSQDEILQIREKINGIKTNSISLADRFNEDIFFNGVNLNSKEDAITYITDKLIEKKYITKEIKEEFFERESISSTEIGNLVAIPHTLHDDIKESFISVLLLKKNILWNKEQVQMVLLIGMAKKEQKQWKQCLEKLYRNIVDIDKALTLVKSDDFNDFYNGITKFE